MCTVLVPPGGYPIAVNKYIISNARVKLAKTGHGPHSSILVVICVVRLLFVLFCILFVCKCVLPPGDHPFSVNKYIISYIISYIIYHYRIVSYIIYIILYDISYIIYHISYQIISYIIYHVSYIVYHISYIIYHISYIIYHISYIVYRIISEGTGIARLV